MFMVLSDKVANNHLVVLDKFEIADFKTKIFDQILVSLENKVFRPADSPAAKPAMNLTGQTELKTKNDKSKKLSSKRSFLIIAEKRDEKLSGSVRNLPGVFMININNINIVDLLKYNNLILTKATIEKLAERYK